MSGYCSLKKKVTKENFDAYKDTNSKKELVEFAGRTHYIIGQEGWQDVAGHVAYWLDVIFK